jgi:hypothetical protein
LKIGFFVQGDADQAFVDGLRLRWCPEAVLEAGQFRGSGGISLRRELPKAIRALKLKGCDVVVVLTDCDEADWRDVRRREGEKIPPDCRHLTVFGVADRNIECWLALDTEELSRALACEPAEIPRDDPSGFVKRGFGLTDRDRKADGIRRISEFVRTCGMRRWLSEPSFEAFYESARDFSQRSGCKLPNERDLV